MTFAQSISSCFRQYVGFHGRARRSEYWWFFLFSALVGFVGGFVDGVLGMTDEFGNGPLGTIVSLALLLPSLAVGVRRLHDTGRSGWWLLIALVPIAGVIVLIIFFVQDSAPGPNAHGPNPKDPVGYAVTGPYGYGQPYYGQPPAPPQGHGQPPAPPQGPAQPYPPATGPARPGEQGPYPG